MTIFVDNVVTVRFVQSVCVYMIDRCGLIRWALSHSFDFVGYFVELRHFLQLVLDMHKFSLLKLQYVVLYVGQ